METINSSQRGDFCFPPHTAITLGNFDGVHLGHVELIRRLKTEAESRNLPSIVVTYSPNPVFVLGNPDGKKCISTDNKKEELIRKLKPDYLYFIEFTPELASKSAEDFLKNTIMNTLNARYILIGFNHCFGREKKGDLKFLEDNRALYRYEVDMFEPILLNGESISSSLIRNFLNAGNIEAATQYLGRCYSFTGTVISGRHVGNEIGFPTANLNTDDLLQIPGNGVYVVFSHVAGRMRPGMMNIGHRPTFKDAGSSVEIHFPNWEGNLYENELEVFVVKKIRDEIRFRGIEELKLQLVKDKEQILQFFKDNLHTLDQTL